MTDTRAAKLRRLWLDVHLWIGVGLALLLIPISISGGLLVWHDDLDTLLNPHRYAVSGAQISHPPSVYLAKASEAVAADPDKLAATGLRYSDDGGPIRVVTRAQNSSGGGRPRFVTVFLDPPTAAVLDVMEFRSSLIGFMHVFHENLMLPQYSGRQIVGWAGVGMLILSLTGIWLWWPRNGNSWSGFVRGLRWTRSSRFTFNLHNMLGFWIAIPLAVVSLTGVYLSFPQTARSAMSSIATMNPQGQRGGFGGTIATNTALSPDRALALAQAAAPDAKPATLLLPTTQRAPRETQASPSGATPRQTQNGERAEGRNAAARGERGNAENARNLSWRIQLARGDSNVTVMIDDATGRARTAPPPQTGDRAASWIRWIHEGSHSGPIWSVIVFLTGVFPTIFAITGVIMWLRKRAARKALRSNAFDGKRQTAELRPAE